MTTQDLLEKVQQRFTQTVKCSVIHDQLIIEVAPEDLLKCCKILRDAHEFRFVQLMDLCGVDYLDYGISEWATDTATTQGFSRGVDPGGFVADKNPIMPARFAVVYQLLSIAYNQRIRVKVFIAGDPLRVPTVTEIWPAANWYEREAFDLYGILFDNHPDLRRLLTDYGFIGHPFRKDFPLIGEVEMRYDATAERVIYEPVSIAPRTLVPKVIKHVGHNS